MHNSNNINKKEIPQILRSLKLEELSCMHRIVCTKSVWNWCATIENHLSESIEDWIMIVKDQYKKNLILIPVKKRKKSSKEEVKVLEEIAQI